ncbi:MAG TPA: cyclic nucleotide-binding domain-containing protein [Azospirillaceae bacterium]|nr:cyclic nucleotide-binding domain-containing protein [Azospirillaceae bacterium]
MQQDVFSRRVYYDGQNIFRDGESGENMYIVQKGKVEIWRERGGSRWVLGTIPVGGIFGEMAIFDGKPRMANATAVAETVVIELPATALREVMRKTDPLLLKLIRILLENTRSLACQVDELTRAAGGDSSNPLPPAPTATT